MRSNEEEVLAKYGYATFGEGVGNSAFGNEFRRAGVQNPKIKEMKKEAERFHTDSVIPLARRYQTAIAMRDRLTEEKDADVFHTDAVHRYDDGKSDDNRLAWLRFNERTDADGKRVLFIEEIQSDWHQAGRDKGYKKGEAPTNYHFEWCEKAIKKGKHVFVEKPLANTMEEARQLVKLAAESGIKFQVGHVERFNPAFLAIKDMELNPMFIEVHRLAQFNPRGTEVSVILDLMIHDIDIILSIVKSDVKSISASGVGVMTETPDIANVRIEFHNGCVANLTSSRISMKKMRKIRLFQKDSYIGIDFLNKKTEIIKLKGPGDTNVFASIFLLPKEWV